MVVLVFLYPLFFVGKPKVVHTVKVMDLFSHGIGSSGRAVIPGPEAASGRGKWPFFGQWRDPRSIPALLLITLGFILLLLCNKKLIVFTLQEW